MVQMMHSFIPSNRIVLRYWIIVKIMLKLMSTPPSNCSVIRASVPKMELDSAFEQKNDIARAVEEELEKVTNCLDDDIQISSILHENQINNYTVFHPSLS